MTSMPTPSRILGVLKAAGLLVDGTRSTLRSGSHTELYFDTERLHVVDDAVAGWLTAALVGRGLHDTDCVVAPTGELTWLVADIATRLDIRWATGNGYQLPHDPKMTGLPAPGRNATIVDVVATRGTRICATVDYLRDRHVRVRGVVVLFDREAGLAEHLAHRRVPLTALLRMSTLPVRPRE